MNMRRISHFLMHVGAAALSLSGLAWSAPLELSENELADVSGQGMVAFTNTQDGGLDFSTITLNADVTLNANFKDLALGTYARDLGAGPVAGTDVNIQHLRFGRSDLGLTAPQRLVSITNPYIEFIYDNSGGAGNSQVVGMRLGFNGISGDISMIASAISGSMKIESGTPAGTLELNGVRQTTLTCTTAPCPALNEVGGLTAGDVNGPSRDMWISLLARPVTFKAPAGVTEAPVQAQAGVWLNWRDRLSAYNISPAGTPATPTPNVAR